MKLLRPFCANRRERRLPAARDDDTPPGACQPQRNGAADAAASTGHDRDSAQLRCLFLSQDPYSDGFRPDSSLSAPFELHLRRRRDKGLAPDDKSGLENAASV